MSHCFRKFLFFTAETLYQVRAPPPYPGATPTTMANDFGPTGTTQYTTPYPTTSTTIGENAPYPVTNSKYECKGFCISNYFILRVYHLSSSHF